MNHSRHIPRLAIVLVAVLVAVILLPAAFIFYVDPYQVYHKSFIPNMLFSDQQRYQNAGLIHSYLSDPEEGYDSVLVSTSLMSSSTPGIIAKNFHWDKTLRIVTGGGQPIESSTELQFALKTGKVKHVLWELHPLFYLWPSDSTQTEAFFPVFLYNNNILDDGPYLFNIDILRMSWQLFHGNLSHNPYPLDLMGQTHNQASSTLGRSQVNQADVLARLKPEGKYVFNDLSGEERKKLQYPQLETYVHPLLDHYCNSGIEFILFTPPWPTFRLVTRGDFVYQNIYAMRHILDRTKNCSNIHLYASELIPYAGDMNYFADSQHPSVELTDYVLGSMARHEHEITLQNVDTYEKNLIHLLNTYQFHSSYPSPLVFDPPLRVNDPM